MADQEEPPQSLSSTFPNPPPFWKDFTPDRIARIAELKERYLDSTGSAKADENASSTAEAQRLLTLRVPNVPKDLVNLQAPAEPPDGKWRVFGDHYRLDDELPTLEEQGITNLPATLGPGDASNDASLANPREAVHHDRALELKRLVKSLLLNFLELTDALSRSPAHAEAKAQDLRTIFINIHHALNEYRPHQARESAIELMQAHLDRTRAETAAIRTQVDKARRTLEGLGSLSIVGADADSAVSFAAAEAERKREHEEMLAQEEAQIWKDVDALLD